MSRLLYTDDLFGTPLSFFSQQKACFDCTGYVFFCNPRAGDFSEAQQGQITFPEISAKVLEKVSQYFYYKLRYTNYQGQLPEFKIEPEYALELLMAANFLDT